MVTPPASGDIIELNTNSLSVLPLNLKPGETKSNAVNNLAL